jgi:D-alanine-D-alanine ligase
MYVGVIYTPVSKTTKARKKEETADCEVYQTANAVQQSLERFGHRVEQVSLDPTGFSSLLKFDWIFNLAETVNGFPLADFEIAERLEALGIPFTGSGSRCLKICANKILTKDKIDHKTGNTPAFQLFEPNAEIVPQIAFPLIVKPSHEDASIGITRRSVVRNLGQLVRQVKWVQRVYRQAALVEEFIDGRDISIGFLGNGSERRLLPPSECVYLENYPGPKIITFESNWVADSPAYQNAVTRCPCDLDPEMMAAVKENGARVFEVLGCRDYARVDFRLKDRTLYILEVNPNPCISPHGSGFILASAEVGLSYDEMIHIILEQSIRAWNVARQPEEQEEKS